MKYTIPKEVYTDLQEVNKDTSFCLGNLSLVRKCYLWHENQGVLWSCSSIFLPFQNLSPSKRNSISVFCLRPLAGVHPLTNNNLINVTLTYQFCFLRYLHSVLDRESRIKVHEQSGKMQKLASVITPVCTYNYVKQMLYITTEVTYIHCTIISADIFYTTVPDGEIIACLF